MNTESYTITSEMKPSIYIFSVGKNAIIPKLVAYERISENTFSLAFGDLDVLTGNVNDNSIQIMVI